MLKSYLKHTDQTHTLNSRIITDSADNQTIEHRHKITGTSNTICNNNSNNNYRNENHDNDDGDNSKNKNKKNDDGNKDDNSTYNTDDNNHNTYYMEQYDSFFFVYTAPEIVFPL